MIIVRSPLRISLGGGGTDLPSFYKNYGGYFLSAAINKYVYITVTRPFEKGIYLKYSEIEKTNRVSDIKHRIIKEVIKLQKYRNPQIEITTLTDIPSRTGLGSSGSFTTGLIKAIYSFNQKIISQKELAELACYIEIEKLKEPSGKQDQYISVYGGISEFNINKRGDVNVNTLKINKNVSHELEDNLLLYFTGFSRDSSTILGEQKKKTKNKDKYIIDSLKFIKELAYEIKKVLLNGQCNEFGKLMHEHWLNKLARSQKISNTIINNIYEYARKHGAIGGKLIGAGGGGFLLFYSSNPNYLRKKMSEKKLEEVRFNFDYEGVKRIY